MTQRQIYEDMKTCLKTIYEARNALDLSYFYFIGTAMSDANNTGYTPNFASVKIAHNAFLDIFSVYIRETLINIKKDMPELPDIPSFRGFHGRNDNIIDATIREASKIVKAKLDALDSADDTDNCF